MTPTWITLLTLLALALAAAGFLVLRRVQTRVPDAPLVELATVPADRGFWLRSRLTESLGGGRPAATPLDSLDLGEDIAEVPALTPVATVAPAAAPSPRPAPLAMPLAATRTAAPLGHSPFANQAVRNGRIGLMDEHDDAPEIAWRTHTAAPTTFSDTTSAPTAPASSSDPTAPITLDRHPDTIEWAGPTD